jgi:methionyl-tRNA synthetase
MSSSRDYRYFTTPIYYASGDLHAGHHYCTLLTGVLSAHYRHRGMDVRMLTGMDEHGEKIEEAAKSAGLAPQQYVDALAERWKKQMADLDLEYDIYLRTSSKEHEANVQNILQTCFDNGDIYFGKHEGDYCVGCESFLTPSQMDEQKNCLDHKRPTEHRVEENYFFRTTKYRHQVIELLKSGRLTSNQRYINELVGIAQSMESDLSISRPKSRTTWGIELPFDRKHVTYVWFDALPNYVTGIGGIETARTSPYWANCCHVLGKEITRFHLIFWPAMLLSMGLPIPRMLIHGWLLSDSFKMSKSLGNATRLDSFGRDTFANTVLRLINPGEDLEVSIRTLIERHNADLANGIGNLLARTLGMIEKYFNKSIPSFSPAHSGETEQQLVARAEALPGKVCEAFDAFRVADALNLIWELIAATDKYISDQKPWVLARDTSADGMAKLGNTLAHAIGSLRVVGLLAAPFFPKKMTNLLDSIGEPSADLSGAIERARSFTAIKSGFVFGDIPKLYMRLEIPEDVLAAESAKSSDKPATAAPAAKPAAASDASATIAIDDFLKVDMRVATVLTAEHVAGSDKLLQLRVSLGELGTRTILAGIRQWVKPEEIANRKVIVVANLAPRKMKFGTSEGMLLATDTQDGTVSPMYVGEDLKEGARLG